MAQVGRAPLQHVASRRDGRTMLTFSRSKRKFRFSQVFKPIGREYRRIHVYRLTRRSIVKACSWDRVTRLRKTLQLCTASLALVMLSVGSGLAQAKMVVLVHGSSTISLEPYARNIIRVTLSTLKDQALAAPGYGFVASPSDHGCTYEHPQTPDISKSSLLIISVAVKPPQYVWLPLTIQVEIANFFHLI